jgi:tetratricopeptide (TPR) repeat protein
MIRGGPQGSDEWRGDETPVERCIGKAYLELDALRPQAALAVLTQCDTGGGPVVESIRAVSRGLIAQSSGATAEAARHFEVARVLGVPLLALLRERAKYHSRLKEYDAAIECCTLRDALEPGAVFELLRDAPDAIVLRLSAWPVAGVRSGNVPPGLFEHVESAMVRAWGEAGARMVLSQILPGGDDEAFRGLERAYQSLQRGDHEAALDTVRDDPGCRNAVGNALACIALAIRAGLKGESGEEDRLMDEAFSYRPPLPYLLSVLGRHFKQKRSDYAKAYECYAALDQIDPDDFIEYSRGLPAAWRCRHAPATMARMILGKRPAVYSLRPTKAALAVRYGSYAAAAILAQLYGADQWRLRRLKLCGMQDHARQHALPYEELIPPRDVEMSAPAIRGRPRSASLRGRSRSVFHCKLKDIVVTGKSNLLMAPDAMLLDFQGDELARIPVHFDVNPDVVSGGDAELTILELGAGARKPALEAAFSLAGLNTSNFGHWIFEFMFQLWALMRRPGFGSLTLIVDRQMPAQMREMLEFFVGPGVPVLELGPGESVQVRELWACAKIAFWPGGEKVRSQSAVDFELSDTRALARLIGTLQPRLQAATREGYPEHIYLTRGAEQSRPLTNRVAVEELFRSKGFAILNFTRRPFIEQLRHLRAASTVIVEAGSAIYGLVLCRPGTRIGEIADEDPTGYEWFSETFKALGLDLVLFPCRVDDAGPDVAGAIQMTADLAELEQYICERTGMHPPVTTPPESQGA